MGKQNDFTDIITSNKDWVYAQMQRISKIGWYIMDLNERTIKISEYLTELFNVKGQNLSFDEFAALIHPDHMQRMKKEFEAWQKNESYDQAYPICTGSEYTWFHMKLEPLKKDAQDHDVVIGTLQSLDPREYERYVNKAYKVQLSNLLDSQSYISQLLLRLLQTSDIDTIIYDILTNIIEKFDADRSYIFSFNLPRRTHSCVYEVTKKGVTSEMDELQDFPMDTTIWWCSQLLEKHTIILDDINVLKEAHPVEFEVLDSQSIKSLMVVPLLSGNGVWGYIGVDIVNYNRLWNDVEQQWFETISNYISVCLELHKTVDTSQRNEATMRNIYRNIPIGIELYNSDGALEDINDVDLNIFSIPDRSHMLGANIFEHPVLPADQIEALRHGKNIVTDVSHIFDDATCKFYGNNYKGRKELFVKCNVLYGFDHQVEHYLMMFIDNTAMLQTYNKMHEFEALFDSISEFAEVGFYSLNVVTKEFFATNQWYKNISVTPPVPGGTTFYLEDYFAVMHPDDCTAFVKYIEEVKARRITSFKQDIRIRNGEEWKCLHCMNMVTEYDQDASSFVIIGLNDNITETKRIEQNLIEAKLKAEESDRLKSAFLANVSHEIRTPLNAIIGFSNLLIDTDDPREREQFMSIIQHNNNQLLQLINDILDLSKIEAGVYDIHYSQIDVNDLCDNIVNSLGIKALPGVTMYFEPGAPDCIFYSDRNSLTQILTNYLGNAAKFTSKGYIKLSYEIKNNNIEFYVRDTGVGLSEQEIQTAFERFVKFNLFVPGTGLGLSICKSIAEKLGGETGVESELGKGSRFWFRLPLATSLIK